MRSAKPPAKPPNVTRHSAVVTANRKAGTMQIKLQSPLPAPRTIPVPANTPAKRLFGKSPTVAAIKPVSPALAHNAMSGLRNPRTQGPAQRKSVDGRLGAELAQQAKAGMKPVVMPAAPPKSKPHPPSW